MRLVLVTHFYPSRGGGVESVAAQLALRMAASGDEVVWCASDCDTPPQIPGVRCEPMGSFHGIERLSGFPYPLWSVASLRRLARCVREADAVHVHDSIYASSLAAALLARRYGKRLVVTQHIGDVPLPLLLRPCLALANRVAAHAVLQGAHAVAFISPVVRQHFQSLTCGRGHFHDVPNGVDHVTFHPGPHALTYERAALGFDPQRPLLLFVGRFVPNKGLAAVHAIASARPDWQWCMIGQGRERPEAWGLPNVRVLGQIAQAALVPYYRASDLLVLPSKSEGFPLVVQEAMACGLPACVPAHVAAGSTMSDNLWQELPALGANVIPRSVVAIAACLDAPKASQSARRNACAAFAAAHWNWDLAARTHAAWLHGGTP